MSQLNSSWQIDPATGDYVMSENGDPVQDNGLLTPSYIRLKTHRTKWLYAPDSKYGSDFYSVRIRHKPSDYTLALTIADQALQPLIDQGRALSAQSSLVQQSRDKIQLQTDVVDVAGNPIQITISPMGA